MFLSEFLFINRLWNYSLSVSATTSRAISRVTPAAVTFSTRISSAAAVRSKSASAGAKTAVTLTASATAVTLTVAVTLAAAAISTLEAESTILLT